MPSTNIVPVLLAGILFGPGCATLTQGTMQDLDIESTPSGARVEIEPGGHVVVTPGRVELHRGTKYVLRFELDGFRSRVVQVAPQEGGVTGGNLLLGGFVGLSVDRDSGAAYALFPNPVRVRLSPLADPEVAASTGPRSRIVFINTTNAEWYDGGLIAIHLDDQLVGTFESHGQIEVDVDPGTHRLLLQHRDMWLFEDEYDLRVEEGDVFLEVFSRPISTKFRPVEPPSSSLRREP